MIVGVLRAELRVGGAQNLKEKRRIIASLLDRVQRQFRVAVAEVDYQDDRQRALLAVACVSTEAQHANQILSHVVGLIEREGEAYLVEYTIEIL